jgi:membrane fusion protein (multidrug efflux system)
MATTPRIRQELQATPVEEQGIKYFDVSDPKSGHKMRMYDFEWLVAQRMDGARPFDEVANWARQSLGIHPSGGDLQEYARRLEDLGFFELEDDYTPLPVSIPADSLGGNGASRSEEVSFEDENPTIPRVVAPEDLRASAQPDAASVSPPAVVVADQEPEPAPYTTPSAPAPRMATPPQKSGSSMSLLWAVVVLALLGGAVVYFEVIVPNAAVHVNVMVASPREVVRLYDGVGTVKKAEPQALSFAEAGKVADVVAKDTEVKAGMALASLDSYAKVQKDVADVKDRLGFYEKQLNAAKTRNDAEAIKNAESKVAEKQKLMDGLEAKAAKLRIMAPGSGTVSDVLIAVGEDAKPGAPVVKIADKRMTADFKLPPADAQAMKAGTAVQLAPASGGGALNGRIANVAADLVSVEVLDDAAAKVGDSLRLVKSRQQNVFRIPAQAVAKRDGADTVFVLVAGEAKARKVSVVDHDGNDALVQSGLASGDSVITTAVETLTDGKKATSEK